MARPSGATGSSSPADLSARLSCADQAFTRLSHAAALAVIRDLGIPAVDICVFDVNTHTRPNTVLADAESVATTIRDRIDGADLDIADVFLILGLEDLAVNHPDPEVRSESREYFEATVRFAATLGSPGLTILPGVPFGGVDPDDGLRLSASELERRADIAAHAGLRLSVEAHVGSIAETPDRALQLLDLAPNLWLTLDLSHFVFQGIPQESVDVLVPRARHVQVRQAAPGMMQAPARRGTIDAGRLVQVLDATGYEGFVGLEYLHDEWLDCDRLDCISETAELRDVLLQEAASLADRAEGSMDRTG